jgi:4,5:9,10-diseco-3-hydroxy-5,9,17-trioxoandrosta-1(10),2-diene-4-oate hydrolase
MLNKALIVAGVVVGSLILLPLIHLAVWSLIPPLSPHQLARTGHFVSIDGIDTYYEHYGSGPPLILIPPAGNHTSTWRFNIGTLSRSHEVWTFDLPGSGYTDKPATFPYTHRSYAQFVRDFMSTMRIPKAAIVGQSLGATVALEFALDFPEQSASVVLIDSGGYSRGVKLGGELGPFNPLRYRISNETLMSFSSYPAVVKAFYHYIYHDPAPFARDAALVKEACEINRTPNALIAVYWIQRALNFDFALPDVDRIKSVAVPTLIIWGREDKVVGVETASRFHEDIAGSQLVIIDDAGHMVHQEKPDAVNRAITSFLDTMRW